METKPRLSSEAVKNNEALIQGHISSLSKTDPDLIEVFDNFAFDEVLRHSTLDAKTSLMIIIASTIATQSLSEFKIIVGAALSTGVSAVEVKEILYQSVAYVGIARALDFIHTANKIFESRGIKLPLESQSTTDSENRFEKGLALQKAIFGDNIDKMYQNSPADLLHFQQFLSANCFGDYQTRTGLDIKTRELITFAILISLGGVEPQVKGHVQGNLNVGNTRTTLISAVTQLLPYIGYPRSLNALQCINEIAPPPSKKNNI